MVIMYAAFKKQSRRVCTAQNAVYGVGVMKATTESYRHIPLVFCSSYTVPVFFTGGIILSLANPLKEIFAIG
jgi:hypothetical protein